MVSKSVIYYQDSDDLSSELQISTHMKVQIVGRTVGTSVGTFVSPL